MLSVGSGHRRARPYGGITIENEPTGAGYSQTTHVPHHPTHSCAARSFRLRRSTGRLPTSWVATNARRNADPLAADSRRRRRYERGLGDDRSRCGRKRKRHVGIGCNEFRQRDHRPRRIGNRPRVAVSTGTRGMRQYPQQRDRHGELHPCRLNPAPWQHLAGRGTFELGLQTMA